MKKEDLMEAKVPDSIRPYLDEIAERLWAGRAAVMVGAGFSKNAGNEFPDWNQLGDLFYQKANGTKPDSAQQKYLNVLRLAEEVQAGIGRPALENLLRANIPDLNIKPSDLHVELLELPWADVFTTNYDTLLERASAKVVTRRYEPVVNKEDIPYADKPRIVKLHGSFPSERPFIITEEDYRRYPYDFAPFVNTVQQALLENTFCLIGFSGDDPNFLQWIGWIRDNLGKDKTQKIYLIGVFDLLPARLQLLAQRGIVVVDLSCCEGIEKHDHKKALERFFGYMQSNKPDVLDWPYKPQKVHPESGAVSIKKVQAITEEWRRQRQAYPGWLIVPHDNRQNLWRLTQEWISRFPDTEKSPHGLDLQYAFELIWRLERCLLPVFDNMVEFFEKLLEKYWPFQNENPPANCKIHPGKEKYQDLPWNDLRQAWLAIAVAMLRFYREEGYLDKWKEAESRLKSLSRHLSAEQREFLHYEGFLFSLFTLDLPNVKQKLENWQPNEAQPYWMAKRAAAFAEIGLLNKMDDQIRLSLVETRKRSKNIARCSSISNEAYQMVLFRYISDINHWNMERNATLEEEQQIKKYFYDNWESNKQISESEHQLNYIIKFSQKKRFSTADEDWEDLVENRDGGRKLEWDQYLRIIRDDQRKREQQQQIARLDEIKAFRCDPWNELKLYELKLDRPSVQRKSLMEERNFDIGRVTKTRLFSSYDQEGLSAYAFLRFCEEVGLPYRVGSYTMATKTALEGLQRISRYSPFWAMATLVRLGDPKAVDSLFCRESVYKFGTHEADQLIKNYLGALNKCRDEIHVGDVSRNNSYGVRLAQLLPEVISRLCCKCSDETKRRVLDFVTEVYASSDKTNYPNTKNLIKRLISSMSKVEQYRLVPDLLKTPFPGEDLHLIDKYEFLNPFLLLEINQKPEGVPTVNIQPGLVDDLFQQAALNEPDRRRWAITSLITLYNLQLLDDVQVSKLAGAIWNVTDQYGLPGGTDFYKFAFLRYPCPENVDPIQLFKNYVLSTPLPIQKNKKDKGVAITGGDIPIVHEIIGANGNGDSIWTAEDASEILQRLLEWWDADKERLKEKENVPEGLSSTADEFRARFSRMLKLIAKVVAPKLNKDSDDEIKSSLSRLLKEVREYGLSGLEAEAACLHIFPDQKADVYNRINEALMSNQDNIRRDGLNAIEKIILDGNASDASSMVPDPVTMLSQYLIWCPINAITPALWNIARILKNSQNRFSDRLETAVQRRLDRLLTDTAYDSENPYLNFDEKLEVRRISSITAAMLWTYYNSRSLPIPEVIEKWRETCTSPDEFSEIRNPWKDRDLA